MPALRPAFLAFCAACAFSAAAGAQPAASSAPAPAAAPANSPELDAAIAVVQMYGPTVHPSVYGSSAYLTLAIGDGRTQNVFVSSHLNGPVGAQTRLVTSNVAKLPAPLDPALALRLLTESATVLPYGYWAVTAQSDGTLLISYEVEMSVNATAPAVQTIMTSVGRRADALEAQLTGKDVY